MKILPILSNLLKVIEVATSKYYLITYSSQKKSSLDAPLIKTVAINEVPSLFLYGLNKQNPLLSYGIIYSQPITEEEYNRIKENLND